MHIDISVIIVKCPCLTKFTSKCKFPPYNIFLKEILNSHICVWSLHSTWIQWNVLLLSAISCDLSTPTFQRPIPPALLRVQNTNDGVGVSLWNDGLFERLVWLSQEGFIGPYVAVSPLPIQLFPGFSDRCCRYGLSHLNSIAVYIATLPLSTGYNCFVPTSIYLSSPISLHWIIISYRAFSAHFLSSFLDGNNIFWKFACAGTVLSEIVWLLQERKRSAF